MPRRLIFAYKAALHKLKKDLYTGAYGRWLFAQKAIRAAVAEAEMDAGCYTTPQKTWVEEEKSAEYFKWAKIPKYAKSPI